MTHKDYKLLVSAIALAGLDQRNQNRLLDSLTSLLEKDNPNFNRAAFLTACSGARDALNSLSGPRPN